MHYFDEITSCLSQTYKGYLYGNVHQPTNQTRANPVLE